MGNFPDIPKSISDYLYEEEGNITRNKLLMVGSMVVSMSVLFALEADAGHGSHKSHVSHSSGLQGSTNHNSHGSSSHTNQASTTLHSNSIHYTKHVSHSSHYNNGAHDGRHVSHDSHSSHQSHTSNTTSTPSHSNHSSHSNSLPKVLTPQKSANALLPESVNLIKNLSIPNLPDTATPVFSSSILSAPAEMIQE